MIKTLILLPALMLSMGCAYFNTFYNAQVYFDSAIADLESNGRTTDGKLPTKAKNDFLTAIDKCLIVLEKYPESRYIEEAIFILGRSYYYNQNDGLAERYFNQLLVDYPNSSQTDEIRVWLARLHAQMGMYDQMDIDLEPIVKQARPDRDLLTEIHLLRGNIALERNRMQRGMEHYIAAAAIASSAARRADIYYRLYALAEADSNYEQSLHFLSEFTKVTPNRGEQLEGRLTKVKLLQRLGRLDEAYLEIKSMEGLTEFVKLIPGMRVQLANIEVGRGNFTDAKPMYLEIQEEFPKDVAASDAAFLLAKIFLIQDRDIKKAQAQFRKVKKNTLYYSEATSNIKQLANMEKYSKTIEELNKKLGFGEKIDPDTRLFANSGGDLELELHRGNKARTPPRNIEETDDIPSLADVDSVAIDTLRIKEELAVAKYRLAEMTIFELLQVEPGLEMMSEITFALDQTSVAPQAAYVLYYYSQSDSVQGEFWRSMLIERYPDSQYARLLAEENQLELATDNVLDSLLENAYSSLDKNRPERALEFFKTIRRTYNTDKANFAIGYLNDEYLSELDGAILAYEEYVTLFPVGEQIEFVTRRLDELRTIKIDSNGVSGQENDNNQ